MDLKVIHDCLGKKVRCNVTGMIGIATAFTVSIGDKVEIKMETQVKGEGSWPRITTLPANRLELVVEAVADGVSDKTA